MGNADSRATSVARAITAITAKVFRCPGLARVAPDADQLGFHDIAYWLIFLTVVAAWFLFLYAPQRERLGMLEGRRQTLTGHVAAEKRELARLQRSIKDLTRGDPQAWERAARGRLGWVEPGEIVDLKNGIPKPPPKAGGDSHQSTSVPPSQTPVLPRPAAPPLPQPPVLQPPVALRLSDTATPRDCTNTDTGSPSPMSPAPMALRPQRPPAGPRASANAPGLRLSGRRP